VRQGGASWSILPSAPALPASAWCPRRLPTVGTAAKSARKRVTSRSFTARARMTSAAIPSGTRKRHIPPGYKPSRRGSRVLSRARTPAVCSRPVRKRSRAGPAGVRPSRENGRRGEPWVGDECCASAMWDSRWTGRSVAKRSRASRGSTCPRSHESSCRRTWSRPARSARWLSGLAGTAPRPTVSTTDRSFRRRNVGLCSRVPRSLRVSAWSS
jgi:hypothetical protein